ncbi:hypothetical protein B0H17DRAFT_1202859 [Mycena rosella]|uniref:Uncharacterized protein n=1 Tax=Mycena rosella TaxID=1033263 RepID=A0AAD7GFE1_MYCRO|nr:hypothetical protein B0H17DRAFT_1202859 [Mycena rosella]
MILYDIARAPTFPLLFLLSTDANTLPADTLRATLHPAPIRARGALPHGSLVRDDFVAATRPVYMRIAEHHSFHPHTPVPRPPPDSTTGKEGMRAGWLPRGARFLPLPATQIEIRVPTAPFTPDAPGSFVRGAVWHGMARHHYGYAGRVWPRDGLIGLVMRPRDRILGLATYFISGHLVGRDTFEGMWQKAAQDVLAPSWGGSVGFARGEE